VLLEQVTRDLRIDPAIVWSVVSKVTGNKETKAECGKKQ
jgi:hypothetical protein